MLLSCSILSFATNVCNLNNYGQAELLTFFFGAEFVHKLLLHFVVISRSAAMLLDPKPVGLPCLVQLVQPDLDFFRVHRRRADNFIDRNVPLGNLIERDQLARLYCREQGGSVLINRWSGSLLFALSGGRPGRGSLFRHRSILRKKMSFAMRLSLSVFSHIPSRFDHRASQYCNL